MLKKWLCKSAILGATLLLAQATVAGSEQQSQASKKEGSCGSFGTTVEFVGTPSEAARQAKRDEKLVFILHVSGHFEDPKLT